MSPTAIAPESCAAAYSCGPVRLALTFDDRSLKNALDGLLSQYDAAWSDATVKYFVTIEEGSRPEDVPESSGAYLQSYRLRVDRRGTHLVSLSNAGVWMDFDEATKRALIRAPQDSDCETVVEEVEQQLVLLLTRAWAGQGWIPLHAGTLIPPEQTGCVLVCAHSGVGKTTFVTAMLREGWCTLGDDKALLNPGPRGVTARSLSRSLHLHPSLSNWFPEMSAIDQWPHYSRWTDKRNVKIEAMWPEQLMDSAIPTLLVQLERGAPGSALEIKPLDPVQTLNALLRQIAIPSDASDARPLLRCAAALAGQVRGVSLAIGENAFANSATGAAIEKVLRELMP